MPRGTEYLWTGRSVGHRELVDDLRFGDNGRNDSLHLLLGISVNALATYGIRVVVI